MSDLEHATRRLITSADRLHDTAKGVTKWAAGVFPGDLPKPLQAIVDAAEDYERSFDEYSSANRGDR